MPTFNHYATQSEAFELVKIVVAECGVRIVPEVPMLEKPELKVYDSLTKAAIASLEEFSVLELEGAFTRHPLQFRKRVSGSAAGSYHVRDDIGPRIRWSLPKVNDENELAPGSLTLYDRYLTPDGKDEELSEALQDAWLDVLDTIQAHLIEVKETKQHDEYWIGKQAKALLDAGKAHFV